MAIASRTERRAAGVDQEIRFCRSRDGTRLAYAVHGSGPPLVVASCWLSHLQYDWQSPVWRHFLDDLGAFATLVRYDERGFGMSDWDVDDFSIEARLGDLESVVEAVGLGRFALLGMSGGSAVARAYAIVHPDRVSRLVALDSRNHILLAGEPAWATFVDEVRAFLEPDRVAAAGSDAEPLSRREREVLALMAEGSSNQGISQRLFLSPKTVETHVGAIFTKLGLLPAADEHRRVLAVLAHLRSLGEVPAGDSAAAD